MLKVELNENESVLILHPEGVLSQEDFENVSKVVDPFIEQTGKLNGILIVSQDFPGWDSFAAFTSHIQFVKAHHKKVKAVAFVTDSALGSVAEHVAKHFVSAQIKSFDFDEFEAAKTWVATVAKA